MAQIKTKAGGIMTFPTAIRVSEGGVWKDCVGKIRESGVWNDVISYQSYFYAGVNNVVRFIDHMASSGTLETLLVQDRVLTNIYNIKVIEMDDLKNLYIGGAAGKIIKTNSAVGTTWEFTGSTSNNVGGLAVDSNYNVYVVAKEYYCKVSPGGSLIWEKTLTDPVTYDGFIAINTAEDRVVVTGKNKMYLIDSSSGVILDNKTGFSRITGLTMSTDNRFVLIDLDTTNDRRRLYRYDINGSSFSSQINYTTISECSWSDKDSYLSNSNIFNIASSTNIRSYNFNNFSTLESHAPDILNIDSIGGTPASPKVAFVVADTVSGGNRLVKIDFNTGSIMYDIDITDGIVATSTDVAISKYPRIHIFPNSWTTNKLW